MLILNSFEKFLYNKNGNNYIRELILNLFDIISLAFIKQPRPEKCRVHPQKQIYLRHNATMYSKIAEKLSETQVIET